MPSTLEIMDAFFIAVHGSLFLSTPKERIQPASSLKLSVNMNAYAGKCSFLTLHQGNLPLMEISNPEQVKNAALQVGSILHQDKACPKTGRKPLIEIFYKGLSGLRSQIKKADDYLSESSSTFNPVKLSIQLSFDQIIFSYQERNLSPNSVTMWHCKNKEQPICLSHSCHRPKTGQVCKTARRYMAVDNAAQIGDDFFQGVPIYSLPSAPHL